MGDPLSKYGQYMIIWIHEPAGRIGVFGVRKALEDHVESKIAAKSPIFRAVSCFEPLPAFWSKFERI